MEAASAYPFLDYLRAEHHVKTPQAQLVQSLSLPVFRAVQLSCKVFLLLSQYRGGHDSDGIRGWLVRKNSHKKKPAARTTAGPTTWRCRHAEFLPISSE
jgi:hypothetical protein